MDCRRLRLRTVVLFAACLAGSACGREGPASAPPIQLVAGPSAEQSGHGAATAYAGPDAPGVVAFPPRNEPFMFREELERKYRDGLRRSPSSTYVDLEGDIVWTQEYLRYRVNRCDHATAAQKVLDQIDGRGIAPVCGEASQSAAVPFPPRNEPYAFRQD
jgi:predicted small lipoprotein YifL